MGWVLHLRQDWCSLLGGGHYGSLDVRPQNSCPSMLMGSLGLAAFPHGAEASSACRGTQDCTSLAISGHRTCDEAGKIFLPLGKSLPLSPRLSCPQFLKWSHQSFICPTHALSCPVTLGCWSQSEGPDPAPQQVHGLLTCLGSAGVSKG